MWKRDEGMPSSQVEPLGHTNTESHCLAVPGAALDVLSFHEEREVLQRAAVPGVI